MYKASETFLGIFVTSSLEGNESKNCNGMPEVFNFTYSCKMHFYDGVNFIEDTCTHIGLVSMKIGIH